MSYNRSEGPVLEYHFPWHVQTEGEERYVSSLICHAMDWVPLPANRQVHVSDIWLEKREHDANENHRDGDRYRR